MNAYDFDGTIYRGDSTAHFCFYCMWRHPRAALSLLSAIWAALLYALGKLNKTAFKQRLFRFLAVLQDVDRDVERFWDKKQRRIRRWYLDQKRPDDAIASASPEFLLTPICRRLGVGLIGSRYDKRTGLCDGVNCDGVEKARRFREEYPGVRPDEFYSDSLNDRPMAELAINSYLVQGERITPWPR